MLKVRRRHEVDKSEAMEEHYIWQAQSLSWIRYDTRLKVEPWTLSLCNAIQDVIQYVIVSTTYLSVYSSFLIEQS